MSTEFRPYCQDNLVRLTGEAGPRVRCFQAYEGRLAYSMERLAKRKHLTGSIQVDIIQLTVMRKQANRDAKMEALRGQGALNPRPKAISDEAFISQEFFDPRDLVQVKYEMLRRHRIDGQQVAEVARCFGVSRQAFYNTEAIFEKEGLPGLVPRRRGPRGAHKCTSEILDFVEQWKAAPSPEQTLVEAIQERFGITINPRSIERALGRRKKKPASAERKRR